MTQRQIRLAAQDVGSDDLRQIAMHIEDALNHEANSTCVTVARPLARLLISALWDLADKVDLDE